MTSGVRGASRRTKNHLLAQSTARSTTEESATATRRQETLAGRQRWRFSNGQEKADHRVPFTGRPQERHEVRTGTRKATKERSAAGPERRGRQSVPVDAQTGRDRWQATGKKRSTRHAVTHRHCRASETKNWARSATSDFCSEDVGFKQRATRRTHKHPSESLGSHSSVIRCVA